MRVFLRRSVTAIALYAVALHVTLLGFLPINPGSFAPVDPFALICHTTGTPDAPGKPPPGTWHFLPGRAIDHCNLGSDAALSPAPGIAVGIDFAWARLTHVLGPLAIPARPRIASNPRLSRAPPRARA